MARVRDLSCVAALLAFVASAPVAGQEPERVSIRVATTAQRGALTPMWAWFGYVEPNYTYMKVGRKLLSELQASSPVPVYVRAHNLLTTGDGTAALKC
jgi:xylan 1,4-beta-xylosidase